MEYRQMRAKILCLCDYMGWKEGDFITYMVAKAKMRKSVVENWLEKEDVQFRKFPTKFLNFWHDLSVPLDLLDFTCSLEDFQNKLARLKEKTPAPPMSGSVKNVTDFHGLAGRYQIIRPHAVYSGAYVLEALEIEFASGEYTTLSFSHHRVDKTFLYLGRGLAEKRYYYTMMSRQHEEFENYQSHRALSFHIEEPRLRSCISGVMLRGVAGKGGREAVALPFIAMRVKTCASLRDINPSPVIVPVDEDLQSESLVRLHPDSHILIGLVRAGSCRKLFDICDGIFNDEAFRTATQKSKGMVLWTVPKGTLQDIPSISEKRWCETIDGLSPESEAEPRTYAGA